jgi:hypothetical protein
VIGHAWPHVAAGEYVAEIVRSVELRDPYAPRSKTRDVVRSKWLLDLRLDRGTDARTHHALGLYQAANDGRAPVTFHSCTIRRQAGTGVLIAPPRAAKLYETLQALNRRSLRPGDRLRLHGFVGRWVRARIVDSRRDSEGYARSGVNVYSVARKIVASLDEPIAGSREPVASSQPNTPYVLEDQRVTPFDFEERPRFPADVVIGVTPPDEESVRDRLGDSGSPRPPSLTPAEERRLIERVFGRGADVNRLGACGLCGLPTFGRFGEVGRCLECGDLGR